MLRSLASHASETPLGAGSSPADLPAASTASDPGETCLENSERKWVTVLFSDLSGYSALCERLDPEDVREMMSRVFKQVVDTIVRYDGYIDRIVGDEVMAVFGMPCTHEDDPVRAVRVALDIHQTVSRMSAQFQDRLDQSLAMHSGIAAGLVVTGRADLTSGRHGITGEPINRASMLTDLAESGEILVDTGIMSATCGFFTYETRECCTGRVKDATIQAHRVIGALEKPEKTRRMQGLQAKLIGRSRHMRILHRHLDAVAGGSAGGCVFLQGEAGTGKSRLVAEFRKAVGPRRVQWVQVNAYAYSQNVPYLPIIDLLRRTVDVRGDDAIHGGRQKIADLLATTSDSDDSAIPIIEQLLTLTNDSVPRIQPESWRLQLKQTLIRLIGNQSGTGLTIICLEDLHWADPSTVDLFQRLLDEAELPVLFVVTHRPGIPAALPITVTNPFYHSQVVQLGNLSAAKSEEMARSLLQCDHVPPPLLTFITDRLSGNPFFLEEAVNALIDAKTLVAKDGEWKITGDIAGIAFSSGVSAVIAARLDSLDGPTKRTLQEASVIGRQFSPLILEKIASDPVRVGGSLERLASLGLLRCCNGAGERHYQFKHALTCEVAYGSLLKRQRKQLHENIARVMEVRTADRTDAFCETLAYHYGNGHSLDRAVFYLQRSGRKAFKRFAIIESHRYFEKAYRMLMGNGLRLEDTTRHILELLLAWFFVFNMRGRFSDALTLMKRHQSMAMGSGDLRLKGMYLACMGWAYQRREQLNRSHRCLLEALSIGEQIHDHKVIAYSCACLIWTCTDLGRLDEALSFSAKAEAASRSSEYKESAWSFEMDQDLVRFVLTGTAIIHWFKGDCRRCQAIGERLLCYGQQAGDVNSISEGYLSCAMGRFAAGDFRGAIDNCLKAIHQATDPLYTVNARFLMAYAHISLDAADRAKQDLDEIMLFCSQSGYEYIGTAANVLSSVVDVASGHLWRGMRAIRRHIGQFLDGGKLYHAMTFHYIVGSIYLKLVFRDEKISGVSLLRNLPFLILHLPIASKRAEHHFKTAISMADRINASGIKAQACLDLGRLYLSQRKRNLAKPLLSESIALFEQSGADKHLEQARALQQSAGWPAVSKRWAMGDAAIPCGCSVNACPGGACRAFDTQFLPGI